MDLNYPEHKHPHGINDIVSDMYRIWVCEECGHIFTEKELRVDTKGWGHSCKSHSNRKGQCLEKEGLRCESHLEPYMPDRKVGIL